MLPEQETSLLKGKYWSAGYPHGGGLIRKRASRCTLDLRSREFLELKRSPEFGADSLRRYGDMAVQSQPNWCVCQRCREMPSDIERKCFGQLPDFCISILPHMDLYILEEGVLRLARRIWNDIRAYGALGHGHRVVIPSCCVWKIRDCFPDPQGQYTGCNPGRV
uniref:P2X purinoreceptor 7 intracellular domain-containing protein n=1 Tax=Sinocyclocheilus grahami TaxID=75366 RepID=A0A672NKW5_SINGR